MGELSANVFFNILLYLSIPFAFGFLFRKLNISPIIGYLFAGILLGNFFSNLIAHDTINNFAFVGIVLLLFTTGLEVNFEKILVLKKFIVTGGLLQVLLSIVGMGLVSTLFGFSLVQAMLIGISLASSSTALVAKIIQERGEESSFTGELALGILMFQDLAFIPFIIIFTFFNAQSGSAGEIAFSIAKGIVEAAVILGGMYYLGKRVVPLIFDRVVKSSRELLNLFIILFIVLIGYFSMLFNVPILIGMFIAGVLVSQTLEHHHIFSQIRPFRDVLAIVFFIFIGTHISLGTIVPILPSIILFSTLLIIVKSAILLAIFLYFKFSSRIAFTLALFLFQVSENAFILLSLAYSHQLFTEEQYLLVITSVLISLVLTPLIIQRKDELYLKVRKFFKKYVPAIETFIQHKVDFDRSPIDTLEIKNHVVICGYGRIGSHIGRALMLADIPFIAIDYNYHAVHKAQREGVPIIYGDPTDRDILDYAQTENAIVLVSAIPDKYAQEAIILNAKKLKPDIYIITRVHQSEHQQRMKDLGAHIVVQPELEASLAIIKRLFMIKHIPKEEMVKKLRYFRVEQGA